MGRWLISNLSLRPLIPGFLCSALIACGGGGGSDDNAAANIAPQIRLESELYAVEQTSITLTADGSSDSDGSISSISWEQTSGPAVTLAGEDTLSPSFTAPATDDALMLSFDLTLTDDDGASSVASIEVAVESRVPPSLAAHFPCEGCRLVGSSLTVTGSAEAGVYPDHIEAPTLRVSVSAGAESVEVEAANDGLWVARDVPLEAPGQTVTFELTATDSYGAAVTETLTLDQRPTITSAFVLPDPENAGVYYLYEKYFARQRLLRYSSSEDVFSMVYDSRGVSELGQVLDVALDPTESRLLLLDWHNGALMAMDIADGSITVVSDETRGSGTQMLRPEKMAIDEVRNRAIIWDEEAEALFTTNLDTGDRTVAANNSGVGTGPELATSGLAYNHTADVAYLFDGQQVLDVSLSDGNRSNLPFDNMRLVSPSSAFYDDQLSRILEWSHFNSDDLLAINPVDGGTTVISASGESGIVIGSGRHIGLDGEQYIINDFATDSHSSDTDSVIAVDSDTGERTILVEDRTGFGPSVEGARNIDIDASGGHLYVVDSFLEAVIQVDLSSRTKTVVSGNGVGGGDVFSSPRDLAVGPESKHIYVLEPTRVQVVDLATGERSVISSGSTGGGPAFDRPTALTRGVNGKLLVTDAGLGAVIQIDTATGDRTIVSDSSSGGDPFVEPAGMAFDFDSGTLLVVDSGTGATSSAKLFSVNPDTGNRTVVSSMARGSGEYMFTANDVQLLPQLGQAVVNDYDTTFLVDLSTGNRQVISSDTQGNGELIHNLHKIAADPKARVVYGYSSDYQALFAIEMTSGDRVVVSK